MLTRQKILIFLIFIVWVLSSCGGQIAKPKTNIFFPVSGHIIDRILEGVFFVSFTPDGKRLASGTRDGVIILWDVETGERLKTITLKPKGDNIESPVSFSPDGSRLASGGEGGTVVLWDVETGELLQILRGHSQSITFISFSSDGNRLATGGGDGTVVLWDAKTGEKIQVFKGKSYRDIESVSFSPDGKRLASGAVCVTISNSFTVFLYKASTCGSSNLIIWDVETGKKLQILEGHTSNPEFWQSKGVTSLSFSPNGKRLASGGVDREIILWDVETGEMLGVLGGHSQSITFISFSPDGKRLASVDRNGTIILWDTPGQ